MFNLPNFNNIVDNLVAEGNKRQQDHFNQMNRDPELSVASLVSSQVLFSIAAAINKEIKS